MPLKCTLCIKAQPQSYAHGAIADEGHVLHYAAMNLAAIRKSKGLTQADLAELIGVDQSTIQRAEKMAPSAKLQTYQQCADALSVSLADIFAEAREPVEVMFLEEFRKIPPENRDKVQGLLDLAKARN